MSEVHECEDIFGDYKKLTRMYKIEGRWILEINVVYLNEKINTLITHCPWCGVRLE